MLSGHLGWVRSISFDPSNQWFATGSNDRTIKIWDFPKSVLGDKDCLKLTLTGHISAVRGLAVSDRHPYLFSGMSQVLFKCSSLPTFLSASYGSFSILFFLYTTNELYLTLLNFFSCLQLGRIRW